MSAERLREAAALMRERAEAFREDGEFVNRWEPRPTIDPDNDGWVVAHDWEADYDSTVAQLPYDYEGQVSRHIASWHPAVALAVADWLEDAAENLDMQAPGGDLCSRWDMRIHINGDKALAVAGAYLGGAS